MNIAFLAPGFLHELGGGITYVSNAKYSIPSADGKTKQQFAKSVGYSAKELNENISVAALFK